MKPECSRREATQPAHLADLQIDFIVSRATPATQTWLLSLSSVEEAKDSNDLLLSGVTLEVETLSVVLNYMD